MNFIKKIGILFFCFAVSVQCSENAFKGLGNKGTDAAILKQIQILSDDEQYTKALSLFSDLTSTARNARETLFLEASVRVGLCGLNFV